MSTLSVAKSLHFEVWFESLLNSGRGLVFPCDEAGLAGVNMDSLSERGRSNYFFARTMLGREFAMPRVLRCGSAAVH